MITLVNYVHSPGVFLFWAPGFCVATYPRCPKTSGTSSLSVSNLERCPEYLPERSRVSAGRRRQCVDIAHLFLEEGSTLPLAAVSGYPPGVSRPVKSEGTRLNLQTRWR
eukprot:526471-Pleurochrysis_carterae.AAC.1